MQRKSAFKLLRSVKTAWERAFHLCYQIETAKRKKWKAQQPKDTEVQNDEYKQSAFGSLLGDKKINGAITGYVDHRQQVSNQRSPTARNIISHNSDSITGVHLVKCNKKRRSIDQYG